MTPVPTLLQTEPVPSSGGGGLTGPVARLLDGAGVPAATAIAGALVFVAVVVAGYLLSRTVLVPLFSRVLESRGRDEHAARPLKKPVLVAHAFASASARARRRTTRRS